MSEEFKLLETGEKSRVVTFRLGESVYSALEKQAQETGGTISATARNILLAGLQGEVKPYEFVFKPGDTLQSKVSSCVVLLVNEPMTGKEVKARLEKLVQEPEKK